MQSYRVAGPAIQEFAPTHGSFIPEACEDKPTFRFRMILVMMRRMVMVMMRMVMVRMVLVISIIMNKKIVADVIQSEPNIQG